MSYETVMLVAVFFVSEQESLSHKSCKSRNLRTILDHLVIYCTHLNIDVRVT